MSWDGFVEMAGERNAGEEVGYHYTEEIGGVDCLDGPETAADPGVLGLEFLEGPEEGGFYEADYGVVGRGEGVLPLRESQYQLTSTIWRRAGRQWVRGFLQFSLIRRGSLNRGLGVGLRMSSDLISGVIPNLVV